MKNEAKMLHRVHNWKLDRTRPNPRNLKKWIWFRIYKKQ